MDEQTFSSRLMQPLIKAYRTWRWVRYMAYFIIFVAVFALLGFFVLPPIAKSVAVSQASKILRRPVLVENFRINPFAMTLDIDGLSVKERESEEIFVSFDHFHIDVDSTSLIKGGFVLSELRLINPQARFVRLENGHFNFSDLIDEFASKRKPEDKQESGADFSLNNIQISGGRLVFDDRVVGEKHEVSDITLALPFVSNMEYAVQSFVEPAFSAIVNGAVLQAKGKSRPFTESMDSELTLDLSAVKVPAYLAYSPIKLPVRLASGTLDAALAIVFRNGEKASLEVSGTASLKDFDVQENDGSALARFGKLDIALGKLDVLARSVVVDRIVLDAPEIRVHIDQQGKLNLTNLRANTPSLSKKAARRPAKSNTKPDVGSQRQAKRGSATDKTGTGLRQTAKTQTAAQDDTPRQAEAGRASISTAAQAQALTTVPVQTGKGTPLGADGNTGNAETKTDLKTETEAGKNANIRAKAAADSGPTKAPPAEKGSGSAQPFVWSLGELEMTNGVVRMLDESRGTPIKMQIEAFDLNLTHLDSAGAKPSGLKTFFRLNGKGEVVVHGKLEPFAATADLNVIIKSLDLLPLQAYFGKQLNVELTRGQLTADGVLQLRPAAEDTNAGMYAPALAGKFAGQATLGNLRAVDKASAEDFLRWKSLYFGKVDVNFSPLSVDIGEIALSDFFARVIVSPEGSLNLMHIVRQQGTTAAAPAAAHADTTEAADTARDEGVASAPVATASERAALTPPIRIEKITLQGGKVHFTDNFVTPNYTAKLKKIGGNVVKLSSEPGAIAHLELRGNYDNIAPLTINAKINPLSDKPYLDLEAEVKGVELTSLSTYAAKYAGYAIEKGKLSLTVNYKIEDDQLQAQNRVFIDQLTFSDKRSDSPDATSLPVKLAVSLLKNRKGEIDLNLPISGTLSDPQFSVGGLIVKVVTNLLSKAVTAPFTLLGSLFGSGEEMSMVTFAAGRSIISENMEKRLENLAKALIERPGLKLEITAVVDSENDREGLKRASIERKVRALKQAAHDKDGGEDAAASVEVGADEYPALLERVYDAEKFPKPRNMIGLPKSLPVAEMEKLMLAHTTVSDEDLQALGGQRAKQVLDWLVSHEVAPERLFLLPVKIAEDASRAEKDSASADEAKKGQNDNAETGGDAAAEKDRPTGNGRVEFSLK